MAFSVHLYVKHGSLLRYFSSSRLRNPYDVLGLKRTCSQKDVKLAYIKMCKELHPDMKPGDTSQHKKFIELNDAYTALINSENKKQTVSKGSYNDTEFAWQYRHRTHNDFESDFRSDKWYETKEYKEYIYRRDKHHTQNRYHRKANLWVVIGCFFLIVLGSVLYLIAFSYASKYKRDTVDEKSKKISEDYESLRKSAMEKGTLEQLHNLQKKWNN